MRGIREQLHSILTQAVKKAGITQTQLVKDTGYSHSTISLTLTGQRKQYATMETLLNSLGYSVVVYAKKQSDFDRWNNE